MHLNPRDVHGPKAPQIPALDRASRRLELQLKTAASENPSLPGSLLDRFRPVRVKDMAWIIQACLDVSETASSSEAGLSLGKQGLMHLKALARQGQSLSEKSEWRGMGWGAALLSPKPLRCETVALGNLFLRAAADTQAAWPLDAAKSVHVFVSAGPGGVFDDGDLFCLSDSIQEGSTTASLAASAMTAAFSASLFHQLAFDEGDAGFSQRLMQGVVNRQRDQGNWPDCWSAEGGQEEQSLLEHARMMNALADYMTVRNPGYEPNYRYGIQWLMNVLSDSGRQRGNLCDDAACVLALTRAQRYWAHEAEDIDFTLAASCREKSNEVAKRFRRLSWGASWSSRSMVLAAQAQSARCQIWTSDPGR